MQPVTEKRVSWLRVRLTPSERAAVERAAHARGAKLSATVRNLLARGLSLADDGHQVGDGQRARLDNFLTT